MKISEVDLFMYENIRNCLSMQYFSYTLSTVLKLTNTSIKDILLYENVRNWFIKQCGTVKVKYDDLPKFLLP